MNANLKIILLHGDTILLRLILAVSSVLWGIMLYWPGETFERSTYTLMGEWFSENTWASIFLFHGIVSLYIILKSPKWPVGVLLEGILGCFLWTSSCLMMLLSIYPPPAAISAEIVVAISSWWILARYPVGAD